MSTYSPVRRVARCCATLTDQRGRVRLSSRVSAMLMVLGCTAFLALAAPSTSLAQQVIVKADDLRVDMSVADHLDRLKEGPQQWQEAFYHDVFYYLHQAHPSAPPDWYREQIDRLRTDIEKNAKSSTAEFRTRREWILSAVNALSESEIGAPFLAGWEIGRHVLDHEGLMEEMDRVDRLSAAADSASTHAYQLDGVIRSLTRSAEEAGRDGKFRSDWNAVFGHQYGTDIGASAEASIARNPALQQQQDILALLTSNGELKADLSKLREILHYKFAHLNDSIADIRERLVELDAKQDVLVAYVASEVARKKRELLAAEARKRLEAAKVGIYLLSEAFSALDPEFGHQVGVVGNAGLQIGTALNDWYQAMNRLKEFSVDKLLSADTILAAGSITGAVQQIASLVLKTKTGDAAIQEEIVQLRKEVHQLRDEMHKRFDKVDRTLLGMYDTLLVRFHSIDEQLWEIRGSVSDVQGGLFELHGSLNRLERNLFDAAADGFRREFWDGVGRWLGYKRRTGLDMLYAPTFVDAESAFHTLATQHSLDRVAIGPEDRPTNDGDLLAQLDGRPAETNINYLNSVIAARPWWGVEPFLRSKAPNPRDYSFGTRAYATLALENPLHAARVASSQAEQIARRGNHLAADLARITVLDTPAGRKPNDELWRRLFENYRDKADGVQAALKSVEQRHAEDRGLDPFGSPDQPLSEKVKDAVFKQYPGGPAPDWAPLRKAARCDGKGASIEPAGREMVTADLPPRYTLAGYFDPGAVLLCWTAEWDYKRREQPYADQWWMPPQHRWQIWVFGRLRFTVQYRHRDQLVGQRTFIAPEELTHVNIWWLDHAPVISNPLYADAFPDPYATVDQRDTDLIEKLTAQGTFYSQPLPAEIESSVDEALRREQGEVYRKVVGALRPGGTASPDAQRLAGARALIAAFLEIGMPRALEGDELLHSLVYGSQRLLDDVDPDGDGPEQPRIRAMFARAALDPPHHHNVRGDVVTTMGDGIASVEQRVKGFLARLAAGEYSETPRLLATSLDRLEFARTIARLEGGDRDGDGIPDVRDRCPDTPRGPRDANGDGCPDAVPPDGRADGRPDGRPDSSAPRITKLRLRPARFAAMRKAAKKPRGRRGSTIRFRLSGDARVRFTIERVRRGRIAGRRCKLGARRAKRRCTTYARVPGRFSRTGRAGANRVRFKGRIDRRALRRGRYRLRARPVTADGRRGNVATRHFVIIRRLP